jgi:hypothetical protein
MQSLQFGLHWGGGGGGSVGGGGEVAAHNAKRSIRDKF